MKRKKVWRYYCEFCKKANCSAPSIKKHEQRCTLNPGRHCGFCDILEIGQPTNIDRVIDLLPNPKDYEKIEDWGGDDKMISFVGLDEATEKVMPKVRELLDSCPACIMSALRRKGIPLPLVKSFNFAKESKEAWADFNEAQKGQEYY